MKKVSILSFIALVALLCATAFAGKKETINFSTSGLSASGAMGSVRQNGAAQDYLGCQILSGQVTPTDLFVECDATSATTILFCISTAASLISVAQTIHQDSLISFSGTSCGPGCCTLTNLSVTNGSTYYPARP
jgi:hypothetical protein